MQVLRNCDGRGSPAKIFLNDRLYTQCPRAISLSHSGAMWLVDTILDCRRLGQFPHPGNHAQQTVFTIQLFDYVEELIAEYERKISDKQRKEAAAAHKK